MPTNRFNNSTIELACGNLLSQNGAYPTCDQEFRMASKVTARPQTITDRYVEAFPRSRELYERARELFPNGVTHDARFLQPFPIYVESAKGSRKWDVDGHELLD